MNSPNPYHISHTTLRTLIIYPIPPSLRGAKRRSNLCPTLVIARSEATKQSRKGIGASFFSSHLTIQLFNHLTIFGLWISFQPHELHEPYEPHELYELHELHEPLPHITYHISHTTLQTQQFVIANSSSCPTPVKQSQGRCAGWAFLTHDSRLTTLDFFSTPRTP